MPRCALRNNIDRNRWYLRVGLIIFAKMSCGQALGGFCVCGGSSVCFRLFFSAVVIWGLFKSKMFVFMYVDLFLCRLNTVATCLE